MKIATVFALYLISGWGSQYDRDVMQGVVDNRQSGRAFLSLPQKLPKVDGYVAWPYYQDLGKVVELRIEGGPWGAYLIVDYPHDDATQRWMLDNDVLVELSGETAAEYDVVGRMAKVEQRITVTREKWWPVPHDIEKENRQ